MPRKVWFVGVGGSGSKTLRFAKRALQRRLETARGRGYESFPLGWRFLSIDLPKEVEVESNVPFNLARGSEYLGVAADTKEYRVYDASLMGRPGVVSEYSTWRPDPAEVTQYPWLGAGQYRHVGRTVMLDQLQLLCDKFREGKEVMTGEQTRVDFDDLCAAFDSPPTGDGDPLMVVVSSLAGGSGSALVLDVCDLIRAAIATEWATTHATVLYLPSVFDSLPEGARVGTEANSYWALTELLNATWDRDFELPHLTAAGLPGNLMTRGSDFNFLVGGSAEGLTFADSTDVFAAVGELLAELALDDEFSSNFKTLTEGNFKMRGHVFRSPVLGERSVATAGLGFSRFGLGRDRFADYAADRLTRTAIEHIVMAHEGLVRRISDASRAAELPRELKVALIIDRDDQVIFHDFLGDLGLDERGKDHNQVLDALLNPRTFEKELEDFRTGVLSSAETGVRGLSEPQVWLNRVSGILATQEDEFLTRVRSTLEVNAASMTKELPVRFSDVVSKNIRRFGGWVTAELLERLNKELLAIQNGLDEERSERISSAELALDRVAADLGASFKKKVSFGHPRIEEAVDRLFKVGTKGRVGSMRREYATSLLFDFRTNLLQPFTREFRVALTRLAEFRETAQYRDLSTGPVADRLRPSPSEVLLVDIEDYPRVLDKLLSETVGAAADTTLAAVLPMLDDSQLPDTQRDSHRLVSIGNWQWSLGRSSLPPQQHVRLTPEELRRRSHVWMRRDTSAGIGAYLTEDLATHLASGDGAVLSHFEQRFSLAIDKARPLIETDETALTALYATSPPSPGLAMTPLPLPTGAPGRETAEKVLLTKGVKQTSLPDYFASQGLEALGGERVRSVSISSQTAPTHPAVISDFLKPVLEKWRTSPHVFAQARRVRSRLEAIPLPRDIMIDLAAGWEVGMLAGLVRYDGSPACAEVLWDDEWQRLPRQGPEGEPSRENELFAVALEAFGLTMLQQATTTDKKMLSAYEGLLALADLMVLEHWIERGQFPETAMPVNWPEQDDATPADRRQTLMKRLGDRERALETEAAAVPEKSGFIGRLAEFAGLRLRAVRRLLRDVPGLSNADMGTSGPRVPES